MYFEGRAKRFSGGLNMVVRQREGVVKDNKVFSLRNWTERVLFCIVLQRRGRISKHTFVRM